MSSVQTSPRRSRHVCVAQGVGDVPNNCVPTCYRCSCPSAPPTGTRLEAGHRNTQVYCISLCPAKMLASCMANKPLLCAFYEESVITTSVMMYSISAGPPQGCVEQPPDFLCLQVTSHAPPPPCVDSRTCQHYFKALTPSFLSCPLTGAGHSRLLCFPLTETQEPSPLLSFHSTTTRLISCLSLSPTPCMRGLSLHSPQA